jgi:RNA polymerase sigma factor (sigma-70 family)
VAVAQLCGGADDNHVRVARVVAQHERTLLRIARLASLCDDDAFDAYQRALEIFVRRAATVDPATEVAWLKVVVRHEALAIRRSRAEAVSEEDVDLDSLAPSLARSVEEQVASTERVRRSAEALRALKPDEANALLLKAHGLSYDEIAAQKGWTYTKVNRAITEGRRRFMRAYEGIESGQECEKFAPILSALARGEASATQIAEIRPHLRHCSSCRATTRGLRLAWLRRTAMLGPFLEWIAARRPLAARQARFSSLGPTRRSTAGEEIALSDGNPQQAPQIALDGPSGPDLAEPGEHLTRLHALKQDVYALLHRANTSDVAMGVHAATTSGSNRLATAAAVLGVCVSGASVGTACMVSGFLTSPPQNTTSNVARGHGKSPSTAHGRSGTSGDGANRQAQTSPTPSPYPVTAAAISAQRAAQETRPTPPTSQPQSNSRARRRARRTAAQNEFGFEQSAASPSAVTSAPAPPVSARAASEAGNSLPPPSEADPAQAEFGP